MMIQLSQLDKEILKISPDKETEEFLKNRGVDKLWDINKPEPVSWNTNKIKEQKKD
jgi:hypothetical protein